jgi:hypothetical protein
MTIERELARIAQALATSLEGRQARLEQEIIDLQKETAKKQAALDAARIAPKRLTDFRVTLGRDFQCPYCWVEHGVRSSLRAVGHPSGGNADIDYFRCNACERGFEG